MTSNYDSEWDRVKDNPDNLIVSDSLRDILDPGAFAGTSNTNPKGIRLISKLTFAQLESSSWGWTDAGKSSLRFVADSEDDKAELASPAVITGAMLSFSRGAKEWCYIFEVKAELLAPILMCGPLVKIEITDQRESFKHELELLEDDAEPTVAFELHALNGDTPATSALLTVTVAAPA